MRQLQLVKKECTDFGGTLNQGKRKQRRPLCTKRPIHLVLKSERNDLYRNRMKLELQLRKMATRFRIRIYGIAVNSDHTHATIRFLSRKEYVAFIRSVTGVLARTLGIRWKLNPFTRVIAWGRDFRNVLDYVRLNYLEAAGLIDRRRHKKYGFDHGKWIGR